VGKIPARPAHGPERSAVVAAAVVVAAVVVAAAGVARVLDPTGREN
jgi:hypothetical protein